MKLVINQCYGGFSLSPQALKAWCDRKGKPCFFFAYDFKSHTYTPISMGAAKKTLMFHALSLEHPNDATEDARNDAYISPRDIPRNDPDLVAVVEALGEAANGSYAALTIIEIPDDVEWEVSEYDGLEHIAEKHRTWP